MLLASDVLVNEHWQMIVATHYLPINMTTVGANVKSVWSEANLRVIFDIVAVEGQCP